MFHNIRLGSLDHVSIEVKIDNSRKFFAISSLFLSTVPFFFARFIVKSITSIFKCHHNATVILLQSCFAKTFSRFSAAGVKIMFKTFEKVTKWGKLMLKKYKF